MKTIIAGSRTITDYEIVKKAIRDSGFEISEVVSGTASGVDRLGERYARENGLPIRQFPAEWNEYGKAAGPIRNVQMAEYADALIAIWDGCSSGTRHMIKAAEKNDLKIFVTKEMVVQA